MPRAHRPSPALVFSLAVSGGLLAVVSLWVRNRPPGRWERDLFSLVNQIPGPVGPGLVLVMQLGAYPAVLVAAAGAVAARRIGLARDLLIAGNLAYWSAVLCKGLVARERPAAFLADIRFHDTITGRFGYPSGHVSVATALGVVLAPALPARLRGLVWLAVAAVGTARIHVGAHLPVDVLGGLLVGWFAASVTRLIVGDVGPGESAGRLRQVLLGRGVEVAELTPVPGDARGSRPWQVTTTDGRRLFVKVTGGRQRDADWLYKLYRRMRYRDIADEPPYVTAKQKNEHEAYLLLLAERSGVRTPGLVTTATDAVGDALLVQEFVPGRTLDALDPAELGPDVLDDVCRQVARLHRAGLAHRDLRAANVLVADSSAWLVDLSFGTEGASADQQARDLVELLVTLAALAGVRPTVDAATRHSAPTRSPTRCVGCNRRCCPGPAGPSPRPAPACWRTSATRSPAGAPAGRTGWPGSSGSPVGTCSCWSCSACWCTSCCRSSARCGPRCTPCCTPTRWPRPAPCWPRPPPTC